MLEIHFVSWQGMKVKVYKSSEPAKDPHEIELAAGFAGVCAVLVCP